MRRRVVERVEDHAKLADLNFLTAIKGLTLAMREPLAVDIGAVGRLHVGDVRLSVRVCEAEVVARHVVGVERDRAATGAANRHDGISQRESLKLPVRPEHIQATIGHEPQNSELGRLRKLNCSVTAFALATPVGETEVDH